MRLAIIISLASLGLMGLGARADVPLIKATVGSHTVYIIPQEYAEAHRKEFLASLPDPTLVADFWTPPEQDVAVADRVFRELIHAAMKDPKSIFPDVSDDPGVKGPDSVEYQRVELALISGNYEAYLRQYVGIITSDGQKLIFCNYSTGPKFDASSQYIFIHKVFQEGGRVHFLQCWFNPYDKTAANVSVVGSWQ